MPLLRVQFAVIGSAAGLLGGQIDDDAGVVVASITLDVGAVPTPSGAQPVVPPGAGLFTRLTAIGGAVYVAVGNAPDPAAEPRHLVLPGETVLVSAPAGARLGALQADAIPPAALAPLGFVSAAARQLTAGQLDALSLNPRGALRVVQQQPDGTDLDPTAPTQTIPGRSNAATVVQVSVTNAAPVAPALAANGARRAARLHVHAGAANVFWGPTAAVTAATGFRLPSGAVHELLPGYSGDVFLIADAAGPSAVSISQLA